MPDGILKFKIYDAAAQIRDDGSLKVTLFYPAENKREVVNRRDYSCVEAVEFGINALTELQEKGYAKIASNRVPIRPASGGMIDVLRDGDFFSHRRDGGTKVHPWYHGIPSGFPSTHEDFSDILRLQKKENAEESILMTLDTDPAWTYLPNDDFGKAITMRSMEGLDIDPRYIIDASVEYVMGPDTLEIRDGTGKNVLGSFQGSIYLSWEHEVSIVIANIRYWPNINEGNVRAVDPQTAAAVDGEFMESSVGRQPLRREMFRFSKAQAENMRFGSPIESPVVYKLGEVDGKNVPVLQAGQPEYPYIFRPDDGLRRMMDTMNLRNWKGLWIPMEIEQEKSRAEELRRADNHGV